MRRFLAVFCLLVLNISFSHAAVTITFSEVGPDVVAVSSGTINTTGFDSESGFGPLRGFVGGTGLDPSFWCFIGLGQPVANRVDAYALSNWTNDNTNTCNTGTQIGSFINSGDFVGFFSRSGSSDGIYVPTGYVSGEPLAGTSTWAGFTIASLNLIPGTYEYTWGTGDDADSLTLIIDADTTNPTLQSSTPADNATGVSIASPSLSLVFDEPVFYTSGLIRMYRTSDDYEVNNRSVSGSTGSGTPNISIGFENGLAIDTEYYVLIPAGAFEDAEGNPYAGISSTTELSFSTGAPAPSYSVEGTVSGLTALGLVLQINGGDNLDVLTNGNFFFSGTMLDDDSAYAVTVLTNPPGQTCSVTNGSGTISGANVTDVIVNCADDQVATYTIGGSVSSLSGSGLVLQNNAGDDLAVAADANFTFATALADGSTYTVTVLTQPDSPAQTCTVGSGSGTLAGADVTDVTVTCADDAVPTYSVGGTVSGLTGTGMELQNNGVDTLAIAADGPFTFLTELVDTTAYAVTVSVQPTGQTCTARNESGTIATADVTNVSVACTDDEVVAPPPVPMVPIPAMSEWALILLTMLLGLMVFANRRRLF